jgi:glycine/serine hydroxymethyltransferase
MKAREMEAIAEAIHQVTAHPNDETVIRETRKRMKALCRRFPFKG